MNDFDAIRSLRSAGFTTYEFVCYVDGRETVAVTAAAPCLPRLYAPSPVTLHALCVRRVRDALAARSGR